MVRILEIINLTYKDFNNINLSFNSKTYYSIIGSNNCGKTTLFRLISGFIPSKDSVFCNDICLNNDNLFKYIANFGIVERINKNSFIYKSVIDEMIYPLHNLGYSKEKSLLRIKEVLSIFHKEDFLNKQIKELNYYDQELLLIMIALLHKPKVLLLDSVLDIFGKKDLSKINNVLKKFVNDGMTIINFTSNLDIASNSDKLILLNNFKIIGEYTKDDIYNNDKLFYENGLEIPFITDLSIKLKMYDLVDKNYTSMKEMVDDLWP